MIHRSNNTSTVYEPDNFLKKGFLYILKEIISELSKSLWFIFQLFRRDFSAMYRQSLIGVSWAFIIPLVSVGTFILLNSSGVLSIGAVDIPYPLFALAGMAFWQIFSIGLLHSSNSLARAGSMIVQINFSKKSLVIAGFMQMLFPFIVQLAISVALFFAYGLKPTIYWVFIPLLILPLIAFTLALGFIFALLNAVLRDIGNILSIFIMLLMFLTPVLYGQPKEGLLGIITNYNPLYYLISVPRDILLFGNFPNPIGYYISSGAAFLALVVFIIIFHITEVRIAERV